MFRFKAIASRAVASITFALFAGAAQAGNLDCSNWQSAHPAWVWCDDFESDSALESNYFEVGRMGGRFGVSGESVFGGSGALRSLHIPAEPEAGHVRFGLGRSPVKSRVATTRDFTEVYWRFYMSTGPTWEGNALKVTRATIFAASNWSQAAIGHLWDDYGAGGLLGTGLDVATGVTNGNVVTTKYNDFDHLRWLGKANGSTQVYSTANRGRWFCVEVQMKLNTPGAADGTFSYWIDDKLEAQKKSIDWRGTYTAYGINAIMLENYVNDGVPHNQTRYFDNLVISTERIGCQRQPMPPTGVRTN
jgi:hypothetical protein